MHTVVDILTARTCVATGKLAERQDTAMYYLQTGRRVIDLETASPGTLSIRQTSQIPVSRWWRPPSDAVGSRIPNCPPAFRVVAEQRKNLRQETL